MKDYSLKINGHNYNVQIDDVNEASTVAHVVVNGVDYEVEIEGAKASTVSKPQVSPAPKSANSAMITPSTATPSPRIAPAPSTSGSSVKCPLPGTVLSVKVAVGDTVAAGRRQGGLGSDARRARSHEDGEQHRRRPRRCCEADSRAAGRYGHGRRRFNRNRVGLCGMH